MPCGYHFSYEYIEECQRGRPSALKIYSTLKVLNLYLLRSSPVPNCTFVSRPDHLILRTLNLTNLPHQNAIPSPHGKE